MSTSGMTKNSALLAGAAVVAAILASGILAAQLGGWGSPETLDLAIREDPVIRVADIASESGLPRRGVFVQRTSTGHFCLWDAPSAMSPSRQGGCNSAEDPLGGRKLFVSFAFDGGPSPSDVTDARLIGLAAGEVAGVQILMSDGTRRKVYVRKASLDTADYLAFGHRVSKTELRRGVAPRAVLALNAAGEEIDRQATGFAG